MKTFATLLTAFLLASIAMPAHAQERGVEQCYNRIAGEMAAVHDEYRSHVFGSRRDREGDVTVLTGGTTDEERTGILETQGRLTSELVAPLVESYRVYRCRTMAICESVRQSIGRPGGDDSSADIKLLGCAPRQMQTYSECAFADNAAEEGTSDQLQGIRMVDECNSLADLTLRTERAVLRLAVSYDAGHRALLQLAGIMDWMLEAFPTQTLRAVAGMVNLLGKLHQIPCFIGQCDNPPTDGLTP